MQKKIAIMMIIILMAGTFTACTTGEKVNNDIKTSVVSKAADVSVSTETSATAATEKTTKQPTPKKPQFQKKQSLRDRIQKPKKKPTVDKIRQVFRKRIRFKKHNPRLRTTAGIQ